MYENNRKDITESFPSGPACPTLNFHVEDPQAEVTQAVPRAARCPRVQVRCSFCPRWVSKPGHRTWVLIAETNSGELGHSRGSARAEILPREAKPHWALPK